MHQTDEAPTLLLQVLHAFWGVVAGLVLGWLLTGALPALPSWIEGSLVIALGVLCGALAYRYGSAFWSALMESWPG